MAADHAMFGMGCFWHAEELAKGWPGVAHTEVGYAGGHLEHPSYETYAKGGHVEVVRLDLDH